MEAWESFPKVSELVRGRGICLLSRDSKQVSTYTNSMHYSCVTQTVKIVLSNKESHRAKNHCKIFQVAVFQMCREIGQRLLASDKYAITREYQLMVTVSRHYCMSYICQKWQSPLLPLLPLPLTPSMEGNHKNKRWPRPCLVRTHMYSLVYLFM